VNDIPFRKYLSIAKQADIEKWNSSKQHYYFMLGVPPHDHRYFIGKDLPSFSSSKNNFWVTNTQANKGIQCRFGMRGVIAESHYDSGKNMVAMLHGSKRYLLSPPYACKYLGIIADRKHPSYRHSVIDWSDLSQCKANHFDKVDAIDTIVHVGEVIYIPSFWFHYIVSLEYSIQCNSRSGFPSGRKGQNYITECFQHEV
jgi:oxalate decarboxylase/phosphoglucose isomerase-like protein (cupin superfamily)